MKILVIGNGGREHALSWRLRQSPAVREIFFTGKNPGIATLATPIDIPATAIDMLADFASCEAIDLTVVGPEAPLAAGIVDLFEHRGLSIFGPTRAAAALETSKHFAKQVMVEAGVPTARYESFTDARSARDYVEARRTTLVVKADGLAFGKGVTICRDTATAIAAVNDALENNRFGEAGARVVIEDFVTGREVSFFALVDGRDAVAMGSARDHKAIFDDDQGPNTGGMGAYSPVPEVGPDLEERIMAEVVRPVAAAMAARGTPYRGVLFVGLMCDGDRLSVLEFNVRFGDPECQALMMRFEGDLAATLAAVTRGNLRETDVRLSPRSAVAIVLASAGYPGEYREGLPISGLDLIDSKDCNNPNATPRRAHHAFAAGCEVKAFHAGTATRDGRIFTDGGRVLSITAAADDLPGAVAAAYEAANLVGFEGMQMRRDIARREISR